MSNITGNGLTPYRDWYARPNSYQNSDPWKVKWESEYDRNVQEVGNPIYWGTSQNTNTYIPYNSSNIFKEVYGKQILDSLKNPPFVPLRERNRPQLGLI